MTDDFAKDSIEGIGPCLDELEQEYLKVGIDYLTGLKIIANFPRS
jgi:hypothetical protein